MSTAGSAIRGALRRHQAPIRDLRAGRPIRTGLIAARYYTRRESRLQNAEASMRQRTDTWSRDGFVWRVMPRNAGSMSVAIQVDANRSTIRHPSR